MGINGIVALLLFTTVACPQSLDIFSEFHRLDPFGAVVPADRGAVTREILSPGVARNGFASFHIAVSVPAKESYLLYVASNPLTACRVDLYREHFVKTAAGWTPDRLSPVERLPDFGTMPDPDDQIEGQTTRLYLLDLWIPPNADVARFRLEVQLKVADWTVRPMEVRVLPARIPDIPRAPEGQSPTLAPPDSPSDGGALGAFAAYLSGAPQRAFGPPKTLREILWRNALQDLILGKTIQPWGAGPERFARNALMFATFPRVLGAEWWLSLRGFIYAQIP